MQLIGFVIFIFAVNGLIKGVVFWENLFWLLVSIAMMVGGEILKHTFLIMRKSLKK